MGLYYGVAIVTLLSGFLCIGMGFTVARAHRRAGIFAQAVIVWILSLGALGRILWLMFWTSATSL